MVVNQPHDKQLGIQLIESLDSRRYRQLTVMVAYAKLSGVYRLYPYIQKFRENGGIVRFVVGIDQQNTTYDALFHLLKVSDSLSVFHSESITQTFHVKCYWLKGEQECWCAIGSNNLTAGGLFSNYELSSTISVSGENAAEHNAELEDIYQIYTDSESACTHIVTEEFLDKLLDYNYIVRELQQRKALVEAAKHSNACSKEKLFGNEVFPTPSLPEEKDRRTKYIRHTTSPQEKKKTQQPASLSAGEQCEKNYLIRLVPKAGDRSKQVHFTIDILERFFCLSPGEDILVQEMFPSGAVGEIEQRKIVFSQRNRNVKIELAGASLLDTNYPENLETRPVLVLKRVNANFFVYMILMDGDSGYSAINHRLKNLPAGRSLPYEVIDEDTMFLVWNDCPIT